MKSIKIKLTDEQIQELKLLQDMADDAYLENKPGAIMAQVFPAIGEMKCRFFTSDKAKEIKRLMK